ncbi:MAG: lysophospholipid acyltransferase family protein [Chloroflexota bacterium]
METLKHIARVYVSVVIWLVACVQLVAWTALILALRLVLPTSRLAPITRLGARLMLRIAGIRLRVEGLERLPRGRPIVLMGNHVNLLDPFLVTAAMPMPCVALERSEHFRWPVYGWLISRWGNIPVYMGKSASARATLKRAQEALAQGLCVVIYPEGTRTRTGQMGPFRRGAFYIAQHARADVVPFTVRGSYAVNQRGSLMIRPGAISIVIGSPLPAATWHNRPLGDLMEATRLAIAREQ